MKITFLGTGPSHGVPVIGCSCSVCTSTDPKNIRYRSSIVINIADTTILVDTPPELRLQAINNHVHTIDGVLFTHQHADHVHGFDDLRVYNEIQREVIPCYANPSTVEDLKNMYAYVFRGGDLHASSPQVTLHPIKGSFCFKNVTIYPVPIYHGKNLILGYRIGNFAYLTDCSSIPESSLPLLQDLELLVIGVLRYRSHPNHLNVMQAHQIIDQLKPGHTLLTHMTHEIEYHYLNNSLPEHISPAYDGMVVSI